MKKCIKIKIFTIIVIIIFLSTTLSSESKIIINEEKTIINNQKNAKWTVMYYICGDDYSMDSYIDPLLENISNIGSTVDLNIITLTDRIGYGNSNIYYINENGTTINLDVYLQWPDEVDMSRSETLEMFCKKIIDSFPSEYYALIIYADGGTGWQKYLLNDQDGKGYLSIPDFAECLKKITKNGQDKLDVLHTSCCMSCIELSYEFMPYVNYLITTQEHISHEKWVKRFYQGVMDLRNNTSMSPINFSKRTALSHIPHTFQMHESYGIKISYLAKIFDKLPFPAFKIVKMHSSVTVVNLSRIDILIKEIQNFSEFLLQNLENKDLNYAIKKARKETREYGKGQPRYFVQPWIYSKLPIDFLSYSCRIDLYQFVEMINNNVDSFLIKNCCKRIIKKINDSVEIINKVDDDTSHGLNIYFPENPIDYNKDIEGGKVPIFYEELSFSRDTKWDEFIRYYLRI